MPRVVHFEIPMDEGGRGVAFYRDVFGWEITKWDGPMPYWLVKTGDSPEPGIDGGLTMRQQPGQSTVAVVAVESVDETTDRVEAAGGSVVAPKMHIAGVGHVAYYQDTEGNVFSVIQGE